MRPDEAVLVDLIDVFVVGRQSVRTLWCGDLSFAWVLRRSLDAAMSKLESCVLDYRHTIERQLFLETCDLGYDDDALFTHP